MNTKIQTLLTPAHAAEWKPFVAEYVRLMTAKKANVAMVSGYRVVKSGAQYEILFNGLRPYGPMNAGTLYGWMQRLPLKYWADEADGLRYDLLVN